MLTWLHLADRSVLRVHPRGNPHNAEEGVFSTRSPDRPNPIGLHRVEIIAIEPPRIQVRHLEAINGTPILDIKPIFNPRDRYDRRRSRDRARRPERLALSPRRPWS